jgi:hypothetical protein
VSERNNKPETDLMKTMENDFRIDGDEGLEILAKHIQRDLKERAFCVVFEDEIELCWPSETIEPSERLNQIEAFAKSRGWKASILNAEIGGTRVIFEDR